MNSYNDENHNNNINNNYNKTNSTKSGFDLIVISLVNVTLSLRSLMWMSLTKATYLLQQKRRQIMEG